MINLDERFNSKLCALGWTFWARAGDRGWRVDEDEGLAWGDDGGGDDGGGDDGGNDDGGGVGRIDKKKGSGWVNEEGASPRPASASGGMFPGSEVVIEGLVGAPE